MIGYEAAKALKAIGFTRWPGGGPMPEHIPGEAIWWLRTGERWWMPKPWHYRRHSVYIGNNPEKWAAAIRSGDGLYAPEALAALDWLEHEHGYVWERVDLSGLHGEGAARGYRAYLHGDPDDWVGPEHLLADADALIVAIAAHYQAQHPTRGRAALARLRVAPAQRGRGDRLGRRGVVGQRGGQRVSSGVLPECMDNLPIQGA